MIQYSRPLARIGNAAWCTGICGILERARVDVVHLHWPFIGGVGAVLRWRLRDARRRLVVQYHMDLVASGWRGVAFMAYQNIRLPHVVTVADRVVVSSLDYARHGALALFLDQLGDRLVEIPLGVDTGRFSPGPRPPRSEGGEGVGSNETMEQWNNVLHVLFVGGLDRAHAFKGAPVLLEAMARVPHAQLRIVGDGDCRVTYEAQTRAFGIANRVEFLGPISDVELSTVYRASDVLVLPSTARSEAFGVVLLEAMASGTPVIASDLPGIRTVVADGETGFLVPPGDARALAERIQHVADDAALRQRMGHAARARAVGHYAWDRVIDRWSTEYTQLCASSS